MMILRIKQRRDRSSQRQRLRLLLATYGALCLCLSIFAFVRQSARALPWPGEAPPWAATLTIATSSTHRRLEKNHVEGDFEGRCTTLCEPTGGFLSLVGAISGQCDCVLWQEEDADNGEAYCKAGYGNTCCGTLDNAGGVVLYMAIILYSFLGLAVICDNYFCESLTLISAALKLSDDVAGATFMAAGSSAPELFTSLVTVLITGGSEGLGTITGSAVFNMMVIVGITAIASCTGEAAKLAIWWFPLVRDCMFYVASIVLMFVFMLDNKIQWWEALILVSTYCGYVYIMKRNEELAHWASEVDRRHREATAAGSVSPASGVEGGNVEMSRSGTAGRNALNMAAMHFAGIEAGDGTTLGSARHDEEASTALIKRATAGNPLFQSAFRTVHGHNRAASATAGARARTRADMKKDLATAVQVQKATEIFLSKLGRKASWMGKGEGGTTDSNVDASRPGVVEDEHEHEDEDGGLLDMAMEMVSLPLEKLFEYTVPDCTNERYADWYVGTFVMSIFWIGFLSFVMCDFSIRVGCVLGIPGLLMGLVFIAAGTSVPDALSSVAVGKSGMGDMAVANVLGSNIFNILLGLGLPW